MGRLELHCGWSEWDISTGGDAGFRGRQRRLDREKERGQGALSERRGSTGPGSPEMGEKQGKQRMGVLETEIVQRRGE